MTTAVLGEKIVTLKCDPEHARILREAHSSIVPGYHMNKRHWISISSGPGIDKSLVEDLVGGAYDLVVQSLPKSRRP